MEQVGVRELNQQTSRVIEKVKRGATVEVTERGRVVARLVPAEPAPEPLAQLVTEGRAIPPTEVGPLPMPAQLGDPDLDVAAELAAARNDEGW